MAVVKPTSTPSRTASGIFWMMLGSSGQILFQFVLFIVLARQLGPLAFGIIGIAAVFIELTGTLGRAGLTEVAIQQKELHEDEASTAFWSSLGVGLVLSALLVVSAYPLERAFAVEGLGHVMMLLAPVCTLYGIGAIYEAKLRRNFGFRALAGRNVTATLISGVVALAMALNDFGVYSLVAQRLIHVAWLFIAMLISTRWLPSLTWKPRVAARQLAAGATLAFASILGTGNQRIIDLIVGYVLGPVSLGYLRIAWRALDLLQELSIRPIAAVVLTSLSHLQDDRPAFIANYLKLVKLTAFFSFPLFFGAAVVANELILLMFGEQWRPSVVPMQILTLTVIFIPLIFYKTNALMAVGAVRMVLGINVFEFVASVLVAYITAHYGLEAAAAGNILRLAVVTPAIFWGVAHSTGIPGLGTLLAIMRPLACSAVMAAALFALRPLLPAMPAFAFAALLAAGGCLLYLGLSLVFQRALMMEAMRLGLGLRPRKRAAA